MNLGELKRLGPRAVFRDEARDFTPWLAEHLPELGEVLGLELELAAREASVGDFCCDLQAKDLGTGKTVIIENQFGSTDHNHLGKLLTYAAGLDADTVIWVTELVRDEHRQALEWLNQHTGTRTAFFAVSVAAFQIDDSRPAVTFTPVVLPNNWQKEARRSAERTSPKAELYRGYFQALIDELRDRYRFTNAKAGQPQNWYSFATGVSGISYSNVFAQGNRVRVELYIHAGDADENEALFDWLQTRRQQIEADLGAELSWERLDERQACRIALYRPGSIELPSTALDEIRRWSTDQLLSFKKVFGPPLREYFQADRAQAQI